MMYQYVYCIRTSSMNVIVRNMCIIYVYARMVYAIQYSLSWLEMLSTH